MNTYNHFVPEAIRSSFVTLLEEESYAEISVTSLCQKAEVGKASFYRYFKSKDDLLEKVIFAYTREWLVSPKDLDINIQQYNDVTKNKFFDHVYNNRNFYTSLYQNHLFYYIKPAIEQVVGDHLLDTKASPYILAWMIGGLLGFVERWVGLHFREDPKEISKLFERYTHSLERRVSTES